MEQNLKEKLLSLPTSSGVYLMKDQNNNIIYIGKAKNLKRRVNSYFINNKKNEKTHKLVANIKNFDYILTKNELDALMLENNLIKKHQPYYNILLKDGKSFPYIKIDMNQEFPKLEITRKINKDKCKYFGPYFNGVDVHKLVELINSCFLIRNCNKNIKARASKPCLNYSIGLCSAPCARYINKEEYHSNIVEAQKFLQGDIKKVKQILTKKMNNASECLNFEKALQLRELLSYLDRLSLKLNTQLTEIINADFFGYYCDGINACVSVLIVRDGKVLGCENYNLISIEEKEFAVQNFILQYYQQDRILPKEIYIDCNIKDKNLVEAFLFNIKGIKTKILHAERGIKHNLLIISINNSKEFLEKSLTKEKIKEKNTIKACERLKTLLNLKSIPYRMECYDISHISGTNKVASMVVFINGEPAKKHYRKFIIKEIQGNNDFGSLMETLKRRLKELKTNDISFSSKPNLIVIAGGKGQLSSVMKVVKEPIDIEFISLAKQNEEIFVPNNPESIKLSKDDVALKLLQNIRDEAHRFAITFHRSKRNKSMVKSALLNIKGVGKVKSLLLLERFGSVENIKNASIEELCLVKGINKMLAIQIKNNLNKS